MISYIKIQLLILIGIFTFQINFSLKDGYQDPQKINDEPIISGIHTLSVHVRDTVLHDSVYHFFLNKLKLPIYYTPVMYGNKKYVGIYAGNMVLEPCGPYQNIDYASDNFKALFFGMNFEVYKSLAVSEQALIERGIKHQVNRGSIYIRDSILCNENVFSALYEVSDKEIRDSLQNILITQTINNPGIEYIKEILIGYKEEANIIKWKEYLHPLELGENDICQINDSLQIHFTKGKINEVMAITFKVESIVEAQQYFRENKLAGSATENKLKLNLSQTFGLSIYFTDEE
jgi:hypothetical protein